MHPTARLLHRTGLALASVALVSCAQAPSGVRGSGVFSPYRIDIPQGNYLDRDMVERVRPGMSRDQVRFALGTPLHADPFRPDRWEYVFRFQHPDLRAELRRVTVFFKDERVEKIQSDALPAANDPKDPALPGTRRTEGRNR
jgi:outer membrane protein assembly factor BamE